MCKYRNKLENAFKKENFEILISTMNRSSLDFLNSIFPFEHFSNFNILIVNQSKESILTSDFPSVRVINSTEFGLSKSRNLAINHAKGKICLIADDDVVYKEGFEKEILKAFDNLQNPVIITFNHQRFGEEFPRRKNRTEFQHDYKSIREVCSIEIAFNLSEIKKNLIYFDENFGLGSYFETAEELLFLREALHQNLRLYYSPVVIVSHPLLSSGVNEGEDKILFARAALIYKTKKEFVYLWLLKYLFFLFRKDYIKESECFKKLKVGLSGIRKYKELEKSKVSKINYGI